MGIFRRNKDNEEDLEDKKEERSGKESGGERTVKVRKIKDLNSGNKKRRKEPIRAWNKFDRIVILLILLLTAGLSFFLAMSSRGYKLPDLPKISIPKINLFGERTVVLESHRSGKTKSENRQYP
jgi:hypothetical protein